MLYIVKRIKNLIKRLTTSGESLTEKTVKGGFWVFTLRISDRIFQLIRTIILARLLSPNDFGLFGIALLVLSTLDTFSQAGFQQALIQKKGETRSYLDTAWTVGLIRGFLIAGIVFFLSKPAAIFFEAPAAENILRIIGISIILQSLNNIAVLYFQKELQFQKFFKYQFLGTIADVTVAITFAFLLKSVWALVFGLLAGNLVRCIMSYVIELYRPRFRFDKAQAKELFGFGKWILGSSILMFLITHGDDIFVGKLLGATMLGFYQMAYRISNLSVTEITNVISQVTFPAYSKIRDNLPKMRKAYFKVLELTVFLSFPLAGLIFVLAPEFVKTFLGERWAPIVPAMQVLAIFGAIRSMGATLGPIYLSMNKPDYPTKLNFLRLVIIAVLIYPLTINFGILGTSLAVLIPAIIQIIIFIYNLRAVIKIRILDFLRCLYMPIILMVLEVGVLFVLKILFDIKSLVLFIVSILVVVLIYIIFIYTGLKFGKLSFLKELKKVVKYHE